MTLCVKNWDRFQHYKDRNPPWIKLHRSLIDDLDYHSLSGDAAKYLILIWIIASEKEGVLPDVKTISFRLHISAEATQTILDELESKEFLMLQQAEQVATQSAVNEKWPSRYIPDAIKKQAMKRDKNKCIWCKSKEKLEYDHKVPTSKGGESTLDNIQILCRSCNRKKRTKTGDAVEQVATQIKKQRSLETETEVEKKERKRHKADFDSFYASYPKKVKGEDAEKAYTKALKKKLPPIDKLLAILEIHKADWKNRNVERQYIPAPSVWLNGKRWTDEIDTASQSRDVIQPKVYDGVLD